MHDCCPILSNALCHCVAYQPDFQGNVPPGEVCVGLYEHKGSLEKAILLALGEGRGIGCQKTLLTQIFEDRATNSLINNEVSSIRVTEGVQNHLDAARHMKEQEQEQEQEQQQQQQQQQEEEEEEEEDPMGGDSILRIAFL